MNGPVRVGVPRADLARISLQSRPEPRLSVPCASVTCSTSCPTIPCLSTSCAALAADRRLRHHPDSLPGGRRVAGGLRNATTSRIARTWSASLPVRRWKKRVSFAPHSPSDGLDTWVVDRASTSCCSIACTAAMSATSASIQNEPWKGSARSKRRAAVEEHTATSMEKRPRSCSTLRYCNTSWLDSTRKTRQMLEASSRMTL
mmetsp:Transcript_7856/g.17588  ORF Transcript_7856/g.17588 Transcript_7856/m.17588 type:complete len:202 (-) Transcript_7856:478-1083(-)